ncbi:hypothetical protein BB561_005505 [Smittium simulii]|uniref:Phosphoribulokinase/uridine kinase domain-containing protein n=1 Tax=Smittium simulii TaxID=133385 RepID=A0A2T9YA38_9FUNG|nr:hypothetical protein BB561_005505 [Smittium simulii]
MEQHQKSVILGIGGPSCSGKTTLAQMLARVLGNSCLVHADDYYKQPGDIPVHSSSGLPDYDSPESFDAEAMARAIQSAAAQSTRSPASHDSAQLSPDPSPASALVFQLGISETRVVVVEGISVLSTHKASAPVLSLLSVAVLLDIDYSTALARRQARLTNLDCSPDDFWPDPPEYFETVAWPNYRKYCFPQSSSAIYPFFLSIEQSEPLDSSVEKCLQLIALASNSF